MEAKSLFYKDLQEDEKRFGFFLFWALLLADVTYNDSRVKIE